MSVLDRAALEASPLADLHAIASELSIDGYRRFRRPELIDAIVTARSDARREPARPPLMTTSSQSTPSPTPRPAPNRGAAAATPNADAEPDAEEEEEAPTAAPSRTPRRARPEFGTPGVRRRGAGGGREEASSRRARRRREESPLQPRTRSLTAPSSFFPTGRDSSASRPPTHRTTTSTSPRLRSSAASSSPATGCPGRAARRGARSGSPPSSGSTRSTIAPPMSSRTAPGSKIFPPRSRASRFGSARRIRHSWRSSGSPRSAAARA